MKLVKILIVTACAVAVLAGPVMAAEDKPAEKKKQTCCEKAKAEGKECTHKCCVAAHKEGKSCETCNPHKEDMKKDKKKKGAKKEEKKEESK